MASRQLAALAASPDDYLRGLRRGALSQVREPVILHWLGEVFDPQLRGYWGSPTSTPPTATFLDLVRAHADKVDGVKVSLLTPSTRSGCAPRCPPGCASTPATTSTTPS